MTALSHPLVIRQAGTADREALTRLAQRDGARSLLGDRVLIAEIEGVPLAALALDSGEAIADPFHPTSALLEVLKLRAAQLLGGHPTRRHGGLRSWLAGLRRQSTGRPAMAPATPGNPALMIRRDR